jgi:hypothetical protein
MKNSSISAVFWSLVGIFILIVAIFFIPPVGEVFRGPQFLLPFIVFSGLGGTLLYFSIREKIKGPLKKFLFLTGASAAGFFVGVFLHNFFYAAAVLTSDIIVFHLFFEMLHGLFFIIAILVCPLGYLVGAAGSLVLFMKERR